MVSVITMNRPPENQVLIHQRHLLYMVAAGVAIVSLGLYSAVVSIVSGNLLRTALSVTALWVGATALQDNLGQWRRARRAASRQQLWRRND